MNHLIAPSVLSCDFANVQRDIEMLNNSEADWIHVDVMDGHFVPNISFGFPVIKAMKKHANKPLDVHLMIENPDQYLEEFKNAGADVISVHIEACKHLHRTVQYIKNLGCKAGVAVNPHTAIDQLEPIISEIDLVCLMSVNPGFGGQTFIENTYKKIEQLSILRQELNPDLKIEIDGGVTDKNAKKLVETGANVLVAGSFVFNAADPVQTIQELKDLV